MKTFYAFYRKNNDIFNSFKKFRVFDKCQFKTRITKFMKLLNRQWQYFSDEISYDFIGRLWHSFNLKLCCMQYGTQCLEN